MSKARWTRRHMLGTAAGAVAAAWLPASVASWTPAARRAPAAGPVVRRNINHLALTDTNVEAYRTAVTAMKALPASDGRSWVAQAAIHASLDASFSLRNQCAHRNWWFLPWHRAYLWYFERIIRGMSGNAEFALPYWNYSYVDQRTIPPAFRTGPLLDATRAAGLNSGTTELDLNRVPYLAALAPTEYTTPSSGAPIGFGGRATGSPSISLSGGILEGTPHGLVHTGVGGDMGAFETAGLDPIFWLHHCNLDRLWSRWHQYDGGRNDPTDPAWLNQSFTFYDEAGSTVPISCKDVIDTRALGYVYDDDPCPPPRIIVVRPPAGGRLICSRYPRLCATIFTPVPRPPDSVPQPIPPGPGPDPSPWFRLAQIPEPTRVTGAAPVPLHVAIDRPTWTELRRLVREDRSESRQLLLQLEIREFTPGSQVLVEIGITRRGSKDVVWVPAGSIPFFRSIDPKHRDGPEVETVDVTETIRLALLKEGTNDSLLWRLRHTTGVVDALTKEPVPPGPKTVTVVGTGVLILR